MTHDPYAPIDRDKDKDKEAGDRRGAQRAKPEKAIPPPRSGSGRKSAREKAAEDK